MIHLHHLLLEDIQESGLAGRGRGGQGVLGRFGFCHDRGRFGFGGCARKRRELRWGRGSGCLHWFWRSRYDGYRWL